VGALGTSDLARFGGCGSLRGLRVAEGDVYVVERLKEFMPSVIEGERMGLVFNMAYGIQGEPLYASSGDA